METPGTLLVRKRLNFCGGQIEKVLKSLKKGRLTIRVPKSTELYVRKPGSQFHMQTEVFIQTGGGTDFECPGDSFRLRTGQVCVMPAGVAHAETPLDLRTPYSILVCSYRADGILLIRGCSQIPGKIMSESADPVETPRGRDAFHYLDQIAVYRSVSPVYRKDYIEGLLRSFYITILDEMRRPVTENSSASQKVVEAEKLARANISNAELSVEMLAVSLKCSGDYLSRLFHRERGMTLSRWIMQERIDMAVELLKNPRHNVAEVGWACGFASTSYFIRVFRQYEHMTPLEFRRLRR